MTRSLALIFNANWYAMQDLIQKIFPYYREIRQRIHSNPELRYEEVKTAELVRKELEKLGLLTQIQVGKTGVVAVLDSGKPGRTVALRAEMDALPILEETQLPYKSQIKGKMHACGHDGHTATLLATANILCTLKDQFSGKIKFIFQPAEEGGAGAKAMIEDGVLDNPSVDAIFAYHNHPGAPLGHLLTRPGCALYGNTEFTIHIKGKGGHAAQPERVVNPIIVSAEVILAIQKIMAELSREPESVVISVTQVNSGYAMNVIPDVSVLMGTIRAASTETYLQAKHLLSTKFDQISEQYQATIELQFKEINPPTINSPSETDFVLTEARACLGENNVSVKARSARASEDFSYYLQQIPGCYFFIGNGEKSPCCHNAKYNFNDELIKVGAYVLSHLAIRFLA